MKDEKGTAKPKFVITLTAKTDEGGTLIRSIATEPAHQEIVDRLTPMLEVLLPGEGAQEIIVSMSRDDANQLTPEIHMSEGMGLAQQHEKMLSQFGLTGFEALEAFMFETQVYNDLGEVQRLAYLVLDHPELLTALMSGDLKVVTDKMCRGCGFFHGEGVHIAQSPVDGTMGILVSDGRSYELLNKILSGDKVGTREMYKTLMAEAKANEFAEGLVFHTKDSFLAESPFSHLAKGLLKDKVLEAVKAHLPKALAAKIKTLKDNAAAIVAAKKRLEADIQRAYEDIDDEEARTVSDQQALQNAAQVLGDAGFTDLREVPTELNFTTKRRHDAGRRRRRRRRHLRRTQRVARTTTGTCV